MLLIQHIEEHFLKSKWREIIIKPFQYLSRENNFSFYNQHVPSYKGDDSV